MTRNAFLLLFGLFPLSGFATVDSPLVQGLAGASRVGIPREGLFSNPASLAFLSEAFAFLHYQVPRVPDYNAGGRGLNVGIYDGGDKNWKGAFGYSRVAKARILANRQSYIDRREFRFAAAHAVTGNILAGMAARLTKIQNVPSPANFLEGDLGAIFPVFGDMRGGLTLENLLDKEDEAPRTLGAGLSYSLGYGFQLMADGYRLMNGTKAGERGWSLAIEGSLTAGFMARAGLSEEAYRALKGWSAGLSWLGPRVSFDYALKSVGSGPKEKTHIFGLTMML